MKSSNSSNNLPRSGYCIYIDTVCEGQIPLVCDGTYTLVFDTEEAAQREIVDAMMIRLQEFLDGEREYDDAITVEEYVLPVQVNRNGTIYFQVSR